MPASNSLFEKKPMEDIRHEKSFSGEALEHVTDSNIDFLEILGRKYINAILSKTSLKECSANELSMELDIPLATVYRKLKLLEECEMVENVKTVITLSGNEEKFYRCLISEATVNFHNGKLSMKMEKIDHIDKIQRLWKRFIKNENISKKDGVED